MSDRPKVEHYPEGYGFKCVCGWTHTISKSGLTNGREVWYQHLVDYFGQPRATQEQGGDK